MKIENIFEFENARVDRVKNKLYMIDSGEHLLHFLSNHEILLFPEENETEDEQIPAAEKTPEQVRNEIKSHNNYQFKIYKNLSNLSNRYRQEMHLDSYIVGIIPLDGNKLKERLDAEVKNRFADIKKVDETQDYLEINAINEFINDYFKYALDTVYIYIQDKANFSIETLTKMEQFAAAKQTSLRIYTSEAAYKKMSDDEKNYVTGLRELLELDRDIK